MRCVGNHPFSPNVVFFVFSFVVVVSTEYSFPLRFVFSVSLLQTYSCFVLSVCIPAVHVDW